MVQMTKVQAYGLKGLPSTGAQAWWDSVRTQVLEPYALKSDVNTIAATSTSQYNALTAAIAAEKQRNDRQDSALSTLNNATTATAQAMDVRIATLQASITDAQTTTRQQAQLIAGLQALAHSQDRQIATLKTQVAALLNGSTVPTVPADPTPTPTASPVVATDQGGGVLALSGTGVRDNNDGTLTLTGSNVSDDGRVVTIS